MKYTTKKLAYRLVSGAMLLGIWLLAIGYEPGPAYAQATDETTGAPVATEQNEKPWNVGVEREVRRAARERFREGNRLFRVPLFAQAAEHYKAALQQWQHPAFYFNLAIAQLNLGQDLDARDNLEHALRYGADPLGNERYREALAQKRELESQLGRIRVQCTTRGAEVSLDGKMLFVGPGTREVWVTADGHQLTARRAGYLPETRQVQVASGQLQRVEFRLSTLGDVSDSSRRWAVWKPWSAVAAGVVVAGAGAFFHSRAARNFDDYDDRFLQLECVTEPISSAPGCTDGRISGDLRDTLNLANRQQAIAVGSYIAGSTAVAVGFALIYLNRPRLSGESASPPGLTNVQLSPLLSPGQVTVRATIRY